MQRQKIQDHEIPIIIRKFNQSLWLSLLIFPFILLIILLPIYILIFFTALFVFNHRIENLLTSYAIFILGIVFLNFLYGKTVIVHKIRKGRIHKIWEDFIIQGKDNYTNTSDTMSNDDRYRLYLMGEDNERRGIYISREDYKKVRIGETLTLVYYEWVDIPVEGFYENERLEFFQLFTVGRWKSIRRKILFPL